MKIVISAPTGYNARELLLPLHEHLSADTAIQEIHVLTPAAARNQELFPAFGYKFHWHANPPDLAAHRQLFKTIQPSIILTPTVGLDRRDTMIIRAGKQQSVPTVTFIASWDNVFKMERLDNKGFGGALRKQAADWELPDYLALWNQMNYDHILASFGKEIDAAHLTITGPPRFDYFAHTDRIPTKAQLLRYLDWPEADPALPLLHFATTELYPFEYIIRSIREAIDRGRLPGDMLLYASVHPGGNMKRHEHYKKYGVRVKYSFGRREGNSRREFAYLPTDEEIYMLIALWQHTSVLINQSSTTAIESMASDTPVINVKYGRPFDWFGWRRSMVYRDFQQHYRYITDQGGTRIVKNPRQLVSQINQYLNNPALEQAERQATLARIITYTDGSSSQRLIDYLKKCAA